MKARAANTAAHGPKRPAVLLLAVVGGTAILWALVVFGRAAANADTQESAISEVPTVAGRPLPMTRRDFFFPGTQPQPDPSKFTHFVGPSNCAVCHTVPSTKAVYEAWRGSMMGQAGRDPLFWAAFAVAGKDATDAGEFCLRCHVPVGWYAGRSDPSDGSALTDADISAGLACEVCHRMVDPVPGAQDEATQFDIIIRAALTSTIPANHSGSAMIILDPQDRRRGPFSRPMNPHPAYQSRFLGQGIDAVTESRLCGSCHNVDNPLLSWTNKPSGGGPAQYWPNEANVPAPSFDKGKLFPLERTFDEWLNSHYAAGGVHAPQFAGAKPGGIVASCQDCHMVRAVGYGANPSMGATYRDCATSGCLPAHIFAGGNAWIPRILQDRRWRLSAEADAPFLDATAAAARSMLRRAASLTLTLQSAGANKLATVRVTNETGHKLPTGYPEGRRMWLNLRAYDAAGTLIYESGTYNQATGQLLNDGALKVYEAKQGLTPELAAAVGLSAGPTFHFALNNTTYKDNRIPPRGYTVAKFDQPGLRPIGAVYKDGQYWDDTIYTLPSGTTRVVATLYYQTASGEYIDFLRQWGGTDGATLHTLWLDDKSPPEIVARVTFPPPNLSYLPVTQGP